MAFFGKVSEVGLPGGYTLKLVDPATQAKVAAQIGATKELTDKPEKAKLAYLGAIAEIESKLLEDAKWAMVAGEPDALTSPGDDYVEDVTARSIEDALS
jgi:hypothetical protein